MKWHDKVVVACVVLSLASGCGGGSAGTGIYSSGIHIERTLGSLDDAETKVACERLKRSVQRSLTKENVCTMTGIFTALLGSAFQDSDGLGDSLLPPGQLVSICEETRTECLNPTQHDDDDNGDDDGEESCLLGNTLQRANCSATVGELEACLSEYVEVLGDRLDVLTCSSDTREEVVQTLAELFSLRKGTVAPQCDSIIERCPSIFDGGFSQPTSVVDS